MFEVKILKLKLCKLICFKWEFLKLNFDRLESRIESCYGSFDVILSHLGGCCGPLGVPGSYLGVLRDREAVLRILK